MLIDTGLRLTCPAHGPSCAADIEVTARRRKGARPTAIGRASLKLRPGKRTWVTFALTPAGAKLLRTAHRLKVTLSIATTTGTTRATATRTITIGAPKPPKRKARS